MATCCCTYGTHDPRCCMNRGHHAFVPHTENPIPSSGWTCPSCGRGNAPWIATCPCYRLTEDKG